jgi:hypothetical protein
MSKLCGGDWDKNPILHRVQGIIVRAFLDRVDVVPNIISCARIPQGVVDRPVDIVEPIRADLGLEVCKSISHRKAPLQFLSGLSTPAV